MKLLGRIKGFTIVELLITITIIVILGGVAIIYLDPISRLKEARDSKRSQELNQIDGALRLVYTQGKIRGDANIVYVSLPDASSTCGSYTYALPVLPAGWSYRCATTDNYLKVDGTGWIPVNFNVIPGGSTLATLPIDARNDVEYYYAYVTDPTDRTFALGSYFESQKHQQLAATKDAGSDSRRYEIGTKVSLLSSSSSNIAINGTFNTTSSGYSPGWDTALNLTYRPTTGFASGYNGGVSSPAVGYHAHIIMNCGEDGTPCMSMIDQNTPYGYTHRWLGSSQSWSDPAGTMGWHNGTKVSIKLKYKTTAIGKPANFGLYHYEGSGYTFGSAIVSRYATTANQWTEATFDVTIPSTWVIGSGYNVSLYLYGHLGSEGTIWYDDVQVTYVN